MKANETPDKIYRTTTYLDSDKGKTIWKNKPVPGAENIEYTRTDAFIGKACKWLEDNLLEYWGQKNAAPDSFIEDFRNYLKGK